jgi:hypothetical protein
VNPVVEMVLNYTTAAGFSALVAFFAYRFVRFLYLAWKGSPHS